MQHRSPTLTPVPQALDEGRIAEPAESGCAAARISTRLVQVTARHLGRGPTKARTTLTPTFAVVVLEDSLTRAERTLAETGREDAVRDVRRAFHALMLA